MYEERQNQLRWQVKLGDSPMPAQDRERVLAERQHSWAVYKVRGKTSCLISSETLVSSSIICST